MSLRHRFKQTICKIAPLKAPEGQTRDHLSNERTLLAYLRTAVNFLLCGITIIELSRFSILGTVAKAGSLDQYDDHDIIDLLNSKLHFVDKYCRPAGILSFVTTFICLALGCWRWYRTYQLLDPTTNQFGSGSVSVLPIFILLLVSIILCYMVASKL